MTDSLEIPAHDLFDRAESNARDNQQSKVYPNVINIMGPTASGKTSLAIELAKKINGEVISVDSALVYRGMDIGTAKPSLAEQDGVRHWLISIAEPEQAYSVAEFCRDAVICIDDILQRGKVPILVGGTMMYFNGLVNGLSSMPNADKNVRVQIQVFIDQHGLEAAHRRLADIDFESGKRIHQNDPQRIMRALEVHALTGKTMTELQAIKPEPLPYNFIQFSLMLGDRAKLHERIAQRFDIMLGNNFEQEVIKLRMNSNLHIDLPAIRSVGYRQMWQYLDGDYDAKEMREKSIIATRQLAKRQITWLRSWEQAILLETGNTKNIDLILQHFQ
ncbi:MAG: tRNA dimethylallyltransferase [Glaciecola sp.]|jgi:tRNA dimethylallyltransferase